jgi:hypothetical protein
MRVLLWCKIPTCNDIAPRRWVQSLDHGHICVLGCVFRVRWCGSWFRLVSHNLGVELGRNQGVVWLARWL